MLCLAQQKLRKVIQSIDEQFAEFAHKNWI
jgi:hypothetical protein